MRTTHKNDIVNVRIILANALIGFRQGLLNLTIDESKINLPTEQCFVSKKI